MNTHLQDNHSSAGSAMHVLTDVQASLRSRLASSIGLRPVDFLSHRHAVCGRLGVPLQEPIPKPIVRGPNAIGKPMANAFVMANFRDFNPIRFAKGQCFHSRSQ